MGIFNLDNGDLRKPIPKLEVIDDTPAILRANFTIDSYDIRRSANAEVLESYIKRKLCGDLADEIMASDKIHIWNTGNNVINGGVSYEAEVVVMSVDSYKRLINNQKENK